MLFNSLEFALFLPVVWLLYWYGVGGSVRAQNLLIVAASYVFYGWWDWRFLSLIFISSLADWIIGRRLAVAEAPRARRLLLGASLAVNLGFLGFFKYFNFFAESFAELVEAFGLRADPVTLQVVLPVGISFYTFQTLSYTIDIYRRQIEPTRDAVAFFAFVSFFPQLVAGPIELASQLLPQFLAPRVFDEALARDGLRLMLWGLFKKVVVADTCARLVDQAFADPGAMRASELWVGAFLFAVQIYGDFSGYSDIARGVARLFGFELMVNFAMPYFARDIGEFWRRWHISLSTWFRDYGYIPLGGSRVDRWRQARNVRATCVGSGLWHGAAWTFVIWGFLHGLYYLVQWAFVGRPPRGAVVAAGRLLPTPGEAVRVAATFLAVLVAWVFFRAQSLADATEYLRLMLAGEGGLPRQGITVLALAVGFLGVEWLQRERRHVLDLPALGRPLRWSVYAGLCVWILSFFGAERTFIYFQF